MPALAGRPARVFCLGELSVCGNPRREDPCFHSRGLPLWLAPTLTKHKPERTRFKRLPKGYTRKGDLHSAGAPCTPQLRALLIP